MLTACVIGGSVGACVSHARRNLLGLPLAGNRERRRVAHGDGLYRVVLESGHAVEVTVQPRTPCRGYVPG